MSTQTAPFSVGDRVRWSGHEIMRKRDRWLNEGREPMKSSAKDSLDKAAAQRGTVLAVEPGRYTPWVCRIKLDDETTEHNCVPYLFERV